MPATCSKTRAGLGTLPHALLREVLSWSLDAASANALLGTCQASYQLRSDPDAAARLLVRHPCQDYERALASCGAACPGGATAVAQQVLQLLRATPHAGGPFTASPLLLRAMLGQACRTGDKPLLQSLFQLPLPPGASDAGHTWALHLLVLNFTETHTPALHTMLEFGADPLSAHVMGAAAAAARRVPALRILLQRCPVEAVYPVATLALSAAVQAWNPEAVDVLLPLAQPRDALLVTASHQAARHGHPHTLQRLLDYQPLSAHDLGTCLLEACAKCHLTCAAVLLDSGADVHFDGEQALQLSVHRRVNVGGRAWSVWDGQRQMAAFLLDHGAMVTADVWWAARTARFAGTLLQLLQERGRASDVADYGAT